MDAAKIAALVAAEKIPGTVLVKWIPAVGQHWPSGEIGQIPVFQAYCECGLRLPAHPFLTLVLEHFGVELVNLGPNSITMLSVFVYLCEAYLGIPSDLELFQYYYGMARQAGIAGSCGLKLHDGKSKEYIQMFTRSSWPLWRKKWFYWETTPEDSLTFAGKAAEKIASWDSTPQDIGRIAPFIQAIEDLKAEGLTGWHVVKDFITRRISPLKKRVPPMWRYTGPKDPTRDYETGKYTFDLALDLAFFKSLVEGFICWYRSFTNRD